MITNDESSLSPLIPAEVMEPGARLCFPSDGPSCIFTGLFPFLPPCDQAQQIADAIEYPHSLSYQLRHFRYLPPVTLVNAGSKIEEYEFPMTSDDTTGVSI